MSVTANARRQGVALFTTVLAPDLAPLVMAKDGPPVSSVVKPIMVS